MPSSFDGLGEAEGHGAAMAAILGLTADGHRVTLALEPNDALAVVGMVQLALRHPGMAGTPSVVGLGRRLVDDVRRQLPGAEGLVDAGWVE